MDHVSLIFYRLRILNVLYLLGQCKQSFQYELKLDLVRVENMEQKWESVYLDKYEQWDGYMFRDAELRQICGGTFSIYDVEIVEVFNRAMRFSLIRRTDDRLLFFNVLFSDKIFVELFFGDVRWPKRQVFEREDIPNEQPFTPLSNRIVYYSKDLDATRFAYPKSFNFVNYGFEARHQGVVLVLLSKTFNISSKIGTNKYVLCSLNVPTHEFALHFSSSAAAKAFYLSIKNDLNREIKCLGVWMTPEIIAQLT